MCTVRIHSQRACRRRPCLSSHAQNLEERPTPATAPPKPRCPRSLRPDRESTAPCPALTEAAIRWARLAISALPLGLPSAVHLLLARLPPLFHALPPPPLVPRAPLRRAPTSRQQGRQGRRSGAPTRLSGAAKGLEVKVGRVSTLLLARSLARTSQQREEGEGAVWLGEGRSGEL